MDIPGTHTHSQTLKNSTKLAEIILSEEIPVGKIVHARHRSIQDAETGGLCCKEQHRLLTECLSQNKDEKGSRGGPQG